MIQIGLIGFGNVGRGVWDIFSENKELLSQRLGQPISIKTVVVRSPEKYNNFDFGQTTLTTDVNAILEDPEISIVVEVMGGEYPAFDYICSALKKGKFVVTANKEVVSKHKKTFFTLAYDNKVDIYFEAAVAGGIPLIRTLKVGFAANKLKALHGILNGTTNYILSKMEETQQDYEVILKEAQQLGFAEADPTMDISGLDAAHKLGILAAVSFKIDVQVSDLYYEGIEKISLKDIQYADELGYRIKLLAIARQFEDNRISLKVHPTMIPKTHPLASITNEVNAAYIVGNAVGEVMLSGKGAGGSPTGSAVVSDIIDIAFDTSKKINRRNLETEWVNAKLVPIEETESQFFIRCHLKDTPCALGKLSGCLGAHKVSISKIFQKTIENGHAEIVVITHPTKEKNLFKAKEELEKLEAMGSIDACIRVRLDEV